MRIFCCSNAEQVREIRAWSYVSIRHADFLLFEQVNLLLNPLQQAVSIRHADFLLFELPLAIFLGNVGNASFNPPCGFFVVRTSIGCRSVRLRAIGFNPPCGFFVVRTGRCPGAIHGPARFQSAMRIFCCSNFGRDNAVPTAIICFNPPCGFFVVRTCRCGCCRLFAISFNPPCGFFVVRTMLKLLATIPTTIVSIRHADFLLFELQRPLWCRWTDDGFNPPCGFFVVRTRAAAIPVRTRSCFNPPCGFFVVRTHH